MLESFSGWLWIVVLIVTVVIVFWLWVRTKKNAAPGDLLAKIKVKIRGWLGAVGQEDFAQGEERVDRLHKELTIRLTNVERGLTQQNRLEDLAVDLRRRLYRLEHTSSQEYFESHAGERSFPRSVQRFGIRMTLTDLIWKDLGIIQPLDLPDHHFDKVFQGPFCRNCLRSLVALKLVDGERVVRHQCRHCLLPWRVDPTTTTTPLRKIKRELYQLLDAEYRKSGTIGFGDET